MTLSLVPSREKAQALILARGVEVNGTVVTHPSIRVSREASITLIKKPQFVSRGGKKLAYALERTEISVVDRVCLDVGISTGGFTDCLLQSGAKQVIGIDVAYGEIDTKLRTDSRLTLFERTNARELPELPSEIDLVVMDVSFISATKILPSVFDSVSKNMDLLILVKPQFEAERSDVKKGGLIFDHEIHAKTVSKVGKSAIELGARVRGVIKSPITGAAGNREFFLSLIHI